MCMMTLEEKTAYLKKVYGLAVSKDLCKNMTEFARLIDINPSSLSAALNTRPEYLTDKLIGRVVMFAASNNLEGESNVEEEESTIVHSVRLIPYEARGGTIGDFVDGVKDYDCEKVISPIKGADFAMEVTGESMSPEFPSGSRVLIKKIDASPSGFIAWNEVYVLDTPNGAVIKRVRKTEDPELVECVSVNPEYQPYTIPKNFIRGWYRVMMVMSLK